MAAQNDYCIRLELGSSHELCDKIIDSLPSLRQTKTTDAQRGGDVWIYEDTKDIKEFTRIVFSKVCTFIKEQASYLVLKS